MWFLVDSYIMINVCFHVQNLTVPKEQIVLYAIQFILTNVSKTNLHHNLCSLVNHPCVLAMNFLATHMCKKYVIKYVPCTYVYSVNYNFTVSRVHLGVN